MNIRAWATALVVVFLTACGGGGGGSGNSGTTPPAAKTLASVSPSAINMSALTTDLAPVYLLTLSATNIPATGLYVEVLGAKGYVTTSFDGTGVNVTGAWPSTLAPGTYQDTVTIKVCFDQQCTEQVGNSPLLVPVTYTVTLGDPAKAVPRIVGFTPTSLVEGGGDITLRVTGANFVPGSVASWNGQPRASTYVSESALDVHLLAADVASVSTDAIMVSNLATGGGVSASSSFQVVAPTPAVTSLSPPNAFVGGSAYTLKIIGTGFDPAAQVLVNSTPRLATWVSSTQLQVDIAAADIATAGTLAISVTNPGPLASNVVPITVAPGALTLGSIAPRFVAAGGPTYVQTILGSGFDPSAVVNWNGNPRSTSFRTTTELGVVVDAADIATPGSVSLTVVNGGSNPGTSGAATLTVGVPSADAVAYQVNPQHNGTIRFKTIVPPTAFPLTPSWTAKFDGVAGYPVVAGGRVFVTVHYDAGGTALYALSSATGAVAWGPIPIGDEANVTYDNGRVITASMQSTGGYVAGWDAATGRSLWSTTLPNSTPAAPPTALNGMVYLGVWGGVFALDDATGAIVWSMAATNGDGSSPTVTADGVYVSYPCSTYAFAPLTGASKWSDNTGCSGAGGVTGTWANGLYYSPIYGGSGKVFNVATGTSIGNYQANRSPAIGPATGYFLQGLSNQTAVLNAVSMTGGGVRWSFQGDGTLMNPALAVNDYVFTTSQNGQLYALDAASGAVLWQTAMGGMVGIYGSQGLGLSGANAGDGLLLLPAGHSLIAYTLSDNP